MATRASEAPSLTQGPRPPPTGRAPRSLDDRRAGHQLEELEPLDAEHSILPDPTPQGHVVPGNDGRGDAREGLGRFERPALNEGRTSVLEQQANVTPASSTGRRSDGSLKSGGIVRTEFRNHAVA